MEMKLVSSERSALFIDGAGLYASSRNIGFEVDYRALLSFFDTRTNLVRAYYYIAILEGDEYAPLKPLTDWLVYNGYTLVSRPAKECSDASGRRRVKSSMDVDIAVDMLELASRIDHAILFSGDADFRRVVEAVQMRGVKVSVVSSIRSSPPAASDELRRQADQFVDLMDIAPAFTRRQVVARTRHAARTALPSNLVSPPDPS